MSLKQELFDRISKHLLNQNRRSISESSYGDILCRYHGDNGLKCAVGAIIPDRKYSENIEGVNVHSQDVINCLPVRYRGESSVYFLRKLQNLHDKVDVSLWKDGLKEIAKDEGLVVNF